LPSGNTNTASDEEENQEANREESRANLNISRHSAKSIILHVAFDDLSESSDCCNICLEEFKEGQEVASSQNAECIHMFHFDCIASWLMAPKSMDKCPVCRNNFLLPATCEPAAADAETSIQPEDTAS